MSPTPSKAAENDVITHTFCESCAEEYLCDELGLDLRALLDTLSVPVIVFDPDVRVRTANSQACALLQKSLADIEGKRGGVAIECSHSKTPAGCGNDIHCQSCTIRNSIQKTFETGKPIVKVKAYPDIQASSKVKKVCVEISTEKVGDVVILRIDDLREVDKVSTETEEGSYGKNCFDKPSS